MIFVIRFSRRQAMHKDDESTIESRLVQACHYIDAATGGISPPLQFSSTYARDVDYEYIGDYSYTLV